MQELGTRLAGVDALAEGLRRHEPVVYADNGFRSTDGHALLARLEALMPALGITRIAELSQLSPLNFPVYQTTRPQIASHPQCGQNTGSQGKGRTALQSKLSCLMEELESVCGEPRDQPLVRASYHELARRALAVDPQRLTSCVEPAGRSEALMWMRAWRLADEEPEGHGVWLPAESVLFPFFPERYATAARFPCSSNGLAAGASYLEAVVHGLYEVVERGYQAFFERDEARVTRLSDNCVRGLLDEEALDALGGVQTIELLAVELPPARANLPMLICLIHSHAHTFAGYGCSATVDISASRAVSEALQAYAVNISGSREDLEASRPAPRARSHVGNCTLQTYRERVIDRRFETLGAELTHLCQWVRGFGFPEILVSNLTRRSIDIPVVKVVVPGMPCPAALRDKREQPAAVDEATRWRFALNAGTGVGRSGDDEATCRVKVYAGLSVSEQQVKTLLPAAEVAGPAARGEIAADVRNGIDVVLLIDGRFQQSLAVSVGEIADALRCGLRIYGASSMGALRAAELQQSGMLPHGAIASWVAEQRYFRDDYLGLRFVPTRPQLRGVAYVDLHFALQQMEHEGSLDSRQRQCLDELYRGLHFAERDRAGLLAAIANHPDGNDTLRELANAALSRPSQKERDALGLLERVATELKQQNRTQRALARSLAGVRRFPFFYAGAGMGLSLRL